MRLTWNASWMLVALALAASPGGARDRQPEPSGGSRGIRHPEDLFVVDCLLPGKVRSLGRHTKIATPRRVARLTVHECQLRGGEHSQDLLDNSWALQSWKSQAEAGDPEALNNVGEIYEQGLRGAPDYAEAARWYRRAAEAGSRRGQRNLAALLEAGLGLEANPAEALAWYRKAAGLTGELELSAEREAARLREELARLAEQRTELENRLAELSAALEEARKKEAQARARVAELERSAAQAAAESQLREQARAEAARLEAERARLAELEAAQDRFRTMLAELEAAEQAARKVERIDGAVLLAKRAPAIEFVQPDVLVTRGPSLVPLPAGTSRAEVLGRVTAGLELAAFTVDGRPHPLEEGGFFRVQLPVEAGKTVRFVAIDRAARRAEAELQLLPEGAEPRTRTAAAAPAPATKARPSVPGRKQLALVFANTSYRGLPRLEAARRDGEALAGVLRELFGFEVRALYDATFLQTMLALEEAVRELGPEDDLLVYFAGHGRLEGTSKGYWLPVDADPQDRSTWLPNEAITRHLARARAARVLVIADSCYAGSLAQASFETAGPKQGRRSRTVLASGGLQPVLDTGGEDGHSVFARALLSVLKLTHEPLTGASLAEAVAARVVWKSSRLGAPQQPLYAPLRHAGHEAGDFVLTPRS